MSHVWVSFLIVVRKTHRNLINLLQRRCGIRKRISRFFAHSSRSESPVSVNTCSNTKVMQKMFTLTNNYYSTATTKILHGRVCVYMVQCVITSQINAHIYIIIYHEFIFSITHTKNIDVSLII